MTLGTETRGPSTRVALDRDTHTHTHMLLTHLSLVACVLYLLSRDQAGFEPLNGGDSWRPRRVQTLKRGRRCGDIPHLRIEAYAQASG